MTTAANLDPVVCEGCTEAVAYLRRTAAATTVCTVCNSVLLRRRQSRRVGPSAPDPVRDERQREARVLADLAAVQRWRAHCSIRGHEPPVAYGDPEPRPHWLRLPEPPDVEQPAHRRDEGRSERDRTRGRQLDARLRELEARVAAQRGMHEPGPAILVAVLVYMMERCGPARIDPEERGRRGPRKHPPRPVAELVGEAFADAKQRRSWRGDAKVGSAAHGLPLVAAAVALWLEVVGDG